MYFASVLANLCLSAVILFVLEVFCLFGGGFCLCGYFMSLWVFVFVVPWGPLGW